MGILSFGLSRLVDGFGVGGAGIAVFILMSETTDTHHRQVVSAAQSVAFAVGAVYTAVLASFIPAWRYLILASNAPCWLVFLAFWASGVFVESPRWLIATGSHSKALAVFRLIADMEGEPLPEWVTPVTVDAFASMLDASKKEGCVETIPILEDELDEMQELVVSDDVSSVPIRVRKDRAVHILYKKPFRRWSYVLFAMWFSASLTYYGVMLDTRHLAEASSWEARYVLKDDLPPVDARLLSQYAFDRGLGEEAPKPVDLEDAPPEKPWQATPDSPADAAPEKPLPAEAAPEKPLPAEAAPEKPLPGGTELFGRASATNLLSAQFQKNHVLSSYFESVRTLAFTLSLSFLLEIPCNILVVWLTGQPWAKRKGTAVGCLFVAAFFCFFAFCLRSRTFIPSRFVIALTNSLANFARLAAGGAYTSLYLISAELFPTTIRSAAVGLCSMWARISAMLSPQIVEILEGARPGGPLLIFAVASFLAALTAVCTLPETFEGPIFDNVQQLQAHDAAFQQKPKESFWDKWFHGGHVARFFIRPHAEPLDTRSPFADLPEEEAPLEWQLHEDSEEIASLDFHVPLSRAAEVELT
ncbi:MAG: hypothetical protein KVP17_000379 [Porospora cf. gigantea B]|nr:MAG: hypothetical protein KVP17_000379 [Porospora cf. gigantea B]